MGFAEEPARAGLSGLPGRQICAQARALGQLHQHPRARSLPFSAFPAPSNYASLPTVSMVIPNLDNDMHDGSIAQGDQWLYQNLSQYASWARANNSLLILTWDEDDNTSRNQIPTVIYGAGRPARHL